MRRGGNRNRRRCSAVGLGAKRPAWCFDGWRLSGRTRRPRSGRASVATAATSQSPAPFYDPKLPVQKRVEDLVSRLSLEEKVVPHADGLALHPAPGHCALTTGGPRRSTA
jgi:hypothetical protein